MTGGMGTSRMEAFSDGVLAIIITIMVLELKAPQGTELRDLLPVVPHMLSYVLSFIYVGIYWNNHHHLLHATGKINGGIMWANLHLLFWLSLVPFVTAWMGENHFEPVPTAAYGLVLLMSAGAYFILQGAIIRRQGEGSVVARAVGRDVKGKLSALFYLIAIGAAFFSPPVSGILYAGVALLWIVPDKRVERVLTGAGQD